MFLRPRILSATLYYNNSCALPMQPPILDSDRETFGLSWISCTTSETLETLNLFTSNVVQSRLQRVEGVLTEGGMGRRLEALGHE